MQKIRDYNHTSSDSKNQSEHLLHIHQHNEQRLQQRPASSSSSSSQSSSSSSNAFRTVTLRFPFPTISLVRSCFLICLRAATKHYCITIFVVIALVAVAYSSSSCSDPPPYILTSLYPLSILDSLTSREAGNFEFMPKEDVPRNPPLSRKLALVAIPVGQKAKYNVAKVIKQINTTDPSNDHNPYFSFMFFHYDDSSWDDFPNYDSIISIRALDQSKFWFAKRFLQPESVKNYDYIVLWDDDISLPDSFDLAEFLNHLKKYHIHFAQPALDGGTRDNLQKELVRHHENEKRGRFTNFVEIMFPIVSTSAWNCAWRLIPYDVKSAWGLDNMWYPACGSLGFCRFAVLDKFPVIHLDQRSFKGSNRNHYLEMLAYFEMGQKVCRHATSLGGASSLASSFSSSSYFSSSSAASAWASLSSYYAFASKYKFPVATDFTSTFETHSPSEMLQSSRSSPSATPSDPIPNTNITTNSSSPSSAGSFDTAYYPQIHMPINPFATPNTLSFSTFCSIWNNPRSSPLASFYNIRPLHLTDTVTAKSILNDGGSCPDPIFHKRGIRNLAWWGHDVDRKDKRKTGYWVGRDREAELRKAKEDLDKKLGKNRDGSRGRRRGGEDKRGFKELRSDYFGAHDESKHIVSGRNERSNEPSSAFSPEFSAARLTKSDPDSSDVTSRSSPAYPSSSDSRQSNPQSHDNQNRKVDPHSSPPTSTLPELSATTHPSTSKPYAKINTNDNSESEMNQSTYDSN
ncbi:hypothetical protein BKA69DRAFT_1036735 [Paraphysoderma sedebokerense]|nr:hypothetical protein BKA69DRAFT_1036735 [Paraphysoderma sedebokerense]